jgi:hypothetical protein
MDERFTQVGKALDTKADKSELDLLERRLTDLIRSLLERFADKNDTNKKLSQLEKKVSLISYRHFYRSTHYLR